MTMQYALILAAAAIAQTHEHKHENHHKRDIKIVTAYDIEYVTELVTVTAGVEPSTYSAPASTSTSSTTTDADIPTSSVYSSPSFSSVQTNTFATSYSSVAAVAYVATFFSSDAYVATSFSSDAYSSSATTSSAPSSYSFSSLSSGISTSNLTPNGKKAGLSGFEGCQEISAFQLLAPHIGWYSDYTPNPSDVQGVKGIGMLWVARVHLAAALRLRV